MDEFHDAFKPSIVDTVSRYVDLRRFGKEFVALCPFHTEKTPSFSVNEDKGVYHCFGCGEAGDVLDFVMKMEGVDFKGALACLGLAGIPRRLKPKKSPERIAAEVMTSWAEKMSLYLSFRMRLLAGGIPIEKETDGLCSRQWNILETLDDDLANPGSLPGIWKQRATVEAIVNA